MMVGSFTNAQMRLSVIFMRFFILYLASLLPFFASGQTRDTRFSQDTTPQNLIRIDHFGKLIEDKEGFETVKWISNGLQLRIDSTNIYADSAVVFGEDRVYAYGNVVIQQGDSLHVFTDTLYYYRETDIAELVGEVVLEQGTRQLWATNLTYHLAERYGEYHQGGTLVDESLQVTSRKGIYYATTEEVVFQDSVVVLHPKFNLAADSMKYQAAESKVLFTGPTNIYTPDAKIYCESGYYDLESEVAEFNLNAQYAGDQKKATADTIRYFSNYGEVLMLGNVLVEENDKRINGTLLRYLEQSGQTWIYGQPAVYRDSTRSIQGPEIYYNEKTNQVSTRGRSEISDGDLLMQAEQFDFDQSTGIGRATGHVIWTDTTNNLGIASDTIDYSQETEYVLAYGKARPLFYTLVDGDTLFIAADTLHMWNRIDTSRLPDTVRMIHAYHDVRLYKSDMQGLADSLVFHGRDSVFNFFGHPVLWSDTTQFSADSITMSIRNSQIRNITLTRRALIISQLLELYYDQIKGKTIVAEFDTAAIKDMWVTGNAESIYYTKDDRAAFIGVNQTICSKMLFTFKDGQIHFLKYYGDNTSTMLPMAEAQHETLRLEGFEWRSGERPLTVNDLLK